MAVKLEPHVYGSQDGVEVTLTNSQNRQRTFANIATKNNWQVAVGNDTYILRTKGFGYVIQRAEDHVQGKYTGCFIPKDFNLTFMRHDKSPGTKEAISKLFQQIQYAENSMRKQQQ